MIGSQKRWLLLSAGLFTALLLLVRSRSDAGQSKSLGFQSVHASSSVPAPVPSGKPTDAPALRRDEPGPMARALRNSEPGDFVSRGFDAELEGVSILQSHEEQQLALATITGQAKGGALSVLMETLMEGRYHLALVQAYLSGTTNFEAAKNELDQVVIMVQRARQLAPQDERESFQMQSETLSQLAGQVPGSGDQFLTIYWSLRSFLTEQMAAEESRRAAVELRPKPVRKN